MPRLSGLNKRQRREDAVEEGGEAAFNIEALVDNQTRAYAFYDWCVHNLIKVDRKFL